jgi:hypothetical protein
VTNANPYVDPRAPAAVDNMAPAHANEAAASPTEDPFDTRK